MRIGAHLVGHLAGDRLHAVDVLAGDAELHRIADRRAVLQAGDAYLQFRERRRSGLDQLGGPLAIADFAGAAADNGAADFLQLMAMNRSFLRGEAS